MTIVYRGKVARFKEELAKHQDTLNNRYREILGSERADKLAEISDRVLTPDAFFDQPEQVSSYKGRLESQSSKFIIGSDMDFGLYPNGRLRSTRARVGVGLYVSEESFKHSGSSTFTDNPLATFIHEFNHFALLALQRTPMYMAGFVMSENAGGKMFTRPEQVADLIERLNVEKMSPQQKKEKIILGTSAYALNDSWERATEVLGKAVLESIGIKPNLHWRNQPREYGAKALLNPPMVVALPVGGDPYKGLSDQEVIDRTLHWEDYFQIAQPNTYVQNLYNSIKDLKIELMPLTQLRRKHEGAQEDISKSPQPTKSNLSGEIKNENAN